MNALDYVEILVLKFVEIKNVRIMMQILLKYFSEMKMIQIVNLSYWKIANML
jgi:hypothetical protein